MAISKDIVQKYIDSALKSEVFEDSFRPYTVVVRDEKSNSNCSTCPGTKRMLLTITTSSEPDKIIRHYVNLMTQVKSTAKFYTLFDVLRLLVQQHPNLCKATCEALLCCEKLDYHNQNSWMQSFGLIAEILPNVDYKGVRDILKHVLEIIYSLPDKFDISIIPQLDTLYATFSMILDREACLLPAYLSLDELQKKITQGNAPVWKFAELFYHFIESFRPTAQIFSIINRPDLLPVVGFSSCHTNSSWRLDPISAKFQLKGLLPYKDKLKEPQVGQIRYLLEQSHSRDMIFGTLSLSSKPTQPRCSELVEQIAVTLVQAMEKFEPDIETYSNSCASTSEQLYQWMHLSNNILFYLVHNDPIVSFDQLIDSLCGKLRLRSHKRGSDHLMWALLQYITGSPKLSLNDFVAVLKLYEILYTGRKPLPLPDENFHLAPQVLAAASIWLQLAKRAEIDQVKFLKPLPPALQLHWEYILNLRAPEDNKVKMSYKDVIFLNAYGLNKNAYPVSNFIDPLCEMEQVQDPMTMQPIPVRLLDSFTTHSKLALMHALVQRLLTMSQNKQAPASNYILTPALIETYGRLLVYTDSESYGIKTLFQHLLGGQQAVWRQQAWHVYHVLLEMYNYRLYHVPLNYKYQMLISLHNMTPVVYGVNQMQLSITMEAAELKLLLGMTSFEAINMPVNSRHSSDAKTSKHMINGDSEELNKVLVLVLARSTHISACKYVTGSIVEEILTDINKVTPLSWSSYTLNFFPAIIKDFFTKIAIAKESDKAQLKPAVEEEYRKWLAMSNDATLVAHFSQPNSPPLFICILWRMVLDSGTLSPVVYRILDNIRTRTLSIHLRTFVDYLVHEFSTSVGGQDVNKYAGALNDLIWKFQIISLDRLLLCMCLRSFDGCEAQVCFFIIQLLLLKISDFKTTVQQYCRTQSPEHWKLESRCCEINAEFQREHPEKFYHNFLAENNITAMGQTLPSYFSNICLRFIPVFDILIHRAIELTIMSPNAAIKIDALLNEFGCLYKFHDKPLTYLYNTLHYYDSQLPTNLKTKLATTIIGSFNGIRPPNWCLSEAYLQQLQKSSSSELLQEELWNLGPDYYRKVIGRLVEALHGNNVFYHTDWRYNEFQNVKAHAIHATAIELMTLPIPAAIVGNAILDLVLTSHVYQDRSTISQWMNAIGLIITALPTSYYSVLNTKILEYMKSPLLTNPACTRDILHLINFCDSYEWMYESQISYLVALTHAIWHHSSTGQIFYLHNFWREDIKQAVETESQFLFACCLIGPFLSRLERSKVMMDVVVELYEMLGKVDSTSEIQHLNTISDFFYHIKYMFTGDTIKNESERFIRTFKPKLQYCFRFITHLNINYEQVRHD